MKRKAQHTGESKKRKLTVQLRYFTRKAWPPARFPEIRLCGKWLDDAGFAHGQRIVVWSEYQKLVITLVAPEKVSVPPVN